MRFLKGVGLMLAALTAAALLGYAAFWLLKLPGSFFSRDGVYCILGAAAAVISVVVTAIIKHDELHASLSSNPPSQLGEKLRGQSGHKAEPPASRQAWDGQWEDPAKAAEKMRSGR